MTIATKTTITLVSNFRKSSTRGPSRSGRSSVAWWRRDERHHDQPGPGGPGHRHRRARGDVDGGGGAELVRLALGLDENAAEPPGRDRYGHRRLAADEARGREGVRPLRAAEDAEHDEDDPEPD